MKEQLPNPAILKHIRVNGQRGSEDRADLLRSKLTERQVVAGEKIRFIQLRLLPRYPVSQLFHVLLYSENSGVSSAHQERLHGKLQRVEHPVEFECIEQIYEGKHHTAPYVRRHIFKGNSWK